MFRAFQNDATSVGQELRPHQTFLLVYPWLESQGLLEACKPLVDFVCVSNTKHATHTGEMPGTGLSATGSLYHPEVDLELYMERMVLHRDITGLKMLGGDHTPNYVVATLASAVEDLKESHLQTRETVRAPITTVRDAFWESNTQRLLALCQVGDTSDLPPVYQAWTSTKKRPRTTHIAGSFRQLRYGVGH